MTLLSKTLIELTENEKKYHSLNGKSILNFPLHVPVGIAIEEFLDDLFYKYTKLLEDQQEIIIRDNNSKEFLDHFYEDINIICTSLIKALEYFKNGKLVSAYNEIGNAIEKGTLNQIELKAEYSKTFYRMRSGLRIKKSKDFYHIPFDKLYLTTSCRFSMQGFPCLYIGYTEDVCKREIGKDGSIIQMDLIEHIEPPLKLIDLTWHELSQENRKNFLKSFPVIAACYIIPHYCKLTNKECDEIKQNFKEQYIIPQLVSAYIREKSNVNGIRYYSTRNENLDPQETNDMNIALFANFNRTEMENGNRIFDENITSGRFVFSNPHDVMI